MEEMREPYRACNLVDLQQMYGERLVKEENCGYVLRLVGKNEPNLILHMPYFGHLLQEDDVVDLRYGYKIPKAVAEMKFERRYLGTGILFVHEVTTDSEKQCHVTLCYSGHATYVVLITRNSDPTRASESLSVRTPIVDGCVWRGYHCDSQEVGDDRFEANQRLYEIYPMGFRADESTEQNEASIAVTRRLILNEVQLALEK